MNDPERFKTHTRLDPKSNPPKGRSNVETVDVESFFINDSDDAYDTHTISASKTPDFLNSRDRIAIEAMNSLILVYPNIYSSTSISKIAERSYEFADAMLKQRNEIPTSEPLD